MTDPVSTGNNNASTLTSALPSGKNLTMAAVLAALLGAGGFGGVYTYIGTLGTWPNGQFRALDTALILGQTPAKVATSGSYTDLLNTPNYSGLFNTPAPAGQFSTGFVGGVPSFAQVLASQVPVTVPNGVARSVLSRAQDEINVVDKGALGQGADYTTQFQQAFSDAHAAGKSVRIPCGAYAFSGTIETYGVPWRGDAEACVLLTSSVNQPILRMTSTGFGVQYEQFGGVTCRFTVANGSPWSNTACVDIEGDNVWYVQDNWFHDIVSQGAYATFMIGKGDANGPFGYEGRVSVNTFSRIRAAGWTNPGKYRFWFKTGSGTANVFEGMSGGSEGANYDGKGDTDPTAAIWRYEGTDPSGNHVVVGDISIVSSQFQAPTRIVSVGAGVVYADNINFAGSQFDGVGNPISFDASPGVTPEGLRIVDANIGGGINIFSGLGTPIQGSVINDRFASKWSAGIPGKNPTTSSYRYFTVEMNQSYSVTTCDFTFDGLIGSYGAAYARVRYAFLLNGNTSAILPALIQQSYVNSDGTVLSAASGNPAAALSTSISAPAPASGANPQATISIVFTDKNGGDTIEGQAECSGGTFRLQRITN